MNFVHTADLHLGYRQYDLDQRLKDFGNSFMKVVEYAIASSADFVLVAGDLFNSRNINAPTFIQAHHVLSMLKDAGIPCIAIAGNHDRAFVRDHMSWLETLEWQGLIRLIKPGSERLMENYADVGTTRIFGLTYAGASTATLIPRVTEEIQQINAASPPEYTILMMHAGIEGQVKGNIVGETPYEDVCKLKDVVDYLALGHYHNAYTLDEWVYNPGSPDTCSLAELSEPKGFYHVTEGKAILREVDRRPFRVIRVDLDGHLNTGSLMNSFEKQLAALKKPGMQPVVCVSFGGCLGFDRSHIDVDSVKQMVMEKLEPLYVDVRFDLTNDAFCLSGVESEGFDRLAIEREVLSRLAQSDTMLADHSHYYAAVLTEVKDLAFKEADAETLDRHLRKAFDDIRTGKAPLTKMTAAEEKLVLEEPPAAEPKRIVEKKAEAPAPKVQRKTLDEFWGGRK